MRIVDEILPTAERLELNRETIQLLVTRGPCLAAAGRIRESVTTLVGAVASATSYGLVDVGLRARINLSYSAAAEDPRMAFDVAREGVELVRRYGMAGYGDYMLGNAAAFALSNGEWEWAVSALEEELSGLGESSARFRLAEFRGLRGEDVAADFAAVRQRVGDTTELQVFATLDEAEALVALARGDFAEALALARRAYEAGSAPDTTTFQIAARAAAWGGDASALTSAIDHFRDKPGRLPAAARREAEAALAAMEGRRADATAGFADAITRWRELGHHVEVGWCAVDWVSMVGPADPQARAAADDARALFDRLGAAPLLALLERAMTARDGEPVAASDDARQPVRN